MSTRALEADIGPWSHTLAHGPDDPGRGRVGRRRRDFLTKPFAAKDLLDAIQRALAKDTRDLGTEARQAEQAHDLTSLIAG